MSFSTNKPLASFTILQSSGPVSGTDQKPSLLRGHDSGGGVYPIWIPDGDGPGLSPSHKDMDPYVSDSSWIQTTGFLTEDAVSRIPELTLIHGNKTVVKLDNPVWDSMLYF